MPHVTYTLPSNKLMEVIPRATLLHLCVLLQVFYQAIKNVLEFDDGPTPLSAAIEVVGRNSAQSYLILFGSYKNESEPPVLKALNINMLARGYRTVPLKKEIIILAVLTFFFK